ncbi:MAG TPA: hypothetical protein VFW78_07050, partial [Bacteroidia bacterium]|nr:hypothetical protein [Bacteroidia bacterium]
MKKLLKLLMIGIIVLSSNVTFAQFIGAAITETAVLSSAVYSTHTGNDYLDDGANTYRVFVWDDLSATRPGIGWDYNSGSQAGYSVFNYSTDIIDPDVSIVIDGNSDVHALVVYY